MGAGHFTRMQQTCLALCSCKDERLMLEKRAGFVPWGPAWAAEGAAGEGWCGGTEM